MIELWSPALSTGSASAKLLTELSSQGMTVKKLINYLNTIEVDTCALKLSPPGLLMFNVYYCNPFKSCT
jgi:hypothetical protein